LKSEIISFMMVCQFSNMPFSV